MPPSDFCTRILRNTCSLSVRIGIAISFFIKTSGTVNILSQKHRRGQGRGLHPHSELANPETQQLWLQPPDGCCVRGALARTPCPLIHVGPCACSLSPQKEGVCLHTPPPGRNTQPPAPALCCLLGKQGWGGGWYFPFGARGRGFCPENPFPRARWRLSGLRAKPWAGSLVGEVGVSERKGEPSAGRHGRRWPSGNVTLSTRRRWEQAASREAGATAPFWTDREVARLVPGWSLRNRRFWEAEPRGGTAGGPSGASRGWPGATEPSSAGPSRLDDRRLLGRDRWVRHGRARSRL